MVKITLGVDGMKCGMCEAHMNEAVRKNFKVKKVESSHEKGCTVILSQGDIDEAKLRTAVEEAGYCMTSFKSEPYEKKGLFSFGKRKAL